MSAADPSPRDLIKFATLGVVRRAARAVDRAAATVCDDLGAGRIEQEPEFTAWLVKGIVEELSQIKPEGVRWEGKILTSSGRKSQESRFGGDFIGAYAVNLPGYSVGKGFLAQAKLVRDGWNLTKSELERARAQCERMLRFTPDSYLFLYSTEGVRVAPATAVLANETEDLGALYTRSISSFFELHFECFIGDPKISEASPLGLERLAEQAEVDRVLMIRLSEPTRLGRGPR